MSSPRTDFHSDRKFSRLNELGCIEFIMAGPGSTCSNEAEQTVVLNSYICSQCAQVLLPGVRKGNKTVLEDTSLPPVQVRLCLALLEFALLESVSAPLTGTA